MSASTTPSLKATDLLAVKSRVSWGAIAAGAMVSLAIYFLLTLTGIAVGIEVAARRPDEVTTLAVAITSIATLLISMFFGGWATSRLAVGETKLEAVLYGVILWGVLFIGMLWMVSTGVRIGFGAILGVASGAVVVTDDNPAAAADKGGVTTLIDRFNNGYGGDKFVTDMTKIGVDEETAKKIQQKYKENLDTLKNDPASMPSKISDQVQGVDMQGASRQAAWYSLAGVVVSMIAVILGSLVGSGDLPVPVPILGVKRRSVDPRL